MSAFSIKLMNRQTEWESTLAQPCKLTELSFKRKVGNLPLTDGGLVEILLLLVHVIFGPTQTPPPTHHALTTASRLST